MDDTYPVYPYFLREEVHLLGHFFPCALQLMDALALKSRQDGIQCGKVLEDVTFLWMKTLWLKPWPLGLRLMIWIVGGYRGMQKFQG
jgi:hypothetical protein